MPAAAPGSFHVKIGDDSRQGVVSAKVYAPVSPACGGWLILAHGAGAGQDSPFMVTFARALAARGLHAVTFNFPYIEQRRRLPDSNATLESCWRAVALAVRDMAGSATLCIGGKSMGGRIASQVAAGSPGLAGVGGLVFLGYPLHPPGRPSQLRVAHWPDLRVPALFVQGTRDGFGSAEEVRAHLPHLGARAELLGVEGGDHSFKLLKNAGRSQDQVYSDIQDAIASWVAGLRP